MNITEALELYKKDLKKIIEREEKKLQKENEKIAAKYNEILKEYSTENDVMDAYGCGMITDRKRIQLLEILEKGNPEKISSNSYLNMLKNDLKSIDLELKYPDDKDHIQCVSDPRVVELEKKLEELEKENKKLKESQENRTKKHNERGAGRKQGISDEDRELIKMYRMQHKTIKELAKMFNCSTGIIHKIINE